MDTDDVQPAQPIVFEIDPDNDINSLALKDMVLTDPIARESAQPSACPRAADTSNKEPGWNWYCLGVFCDAVPCFWPLFTF
jgi:hypothetical protein